MIDNLSPSEGLPNVGDLIKLKSYDSGSRGTIALFKDRGEWRPDGVGDRVSPEDVLFVIEVRMLEGLADHSSPDKPARRADVLFLTPRGIQGWDRWAPEEHVHKGFNTFSDFWTPARRQSNNE